MMRSYALLLALLPIAITAQPPLPGFLISDTITIPCPQDSSIQILTYTGWEAYQTIDDTWYGERDSNVCINLAHQVSSTWFSPMIEFDEIDPLRPVFLRVLYSEEFVLPLDSNTQYSIGVGAYTQSAFDVDPCPDGPCSNIRAAVRIPDSTGTGYDLRWYESGAETDMWSQYPFNLCVPTEKFTNNDLRELIVSMKAIDPEPGGSFSLYQSELIDLDQWGQLTQLTEAVLPQYNTGPLSYEFEGFSWENFLVMYTDTTYPDIDHVSYLDFSPIPNLPQPTPVTITLGPFTGFNFQPYTQFRGELVAGSDSLRHPITVVNQGADLCLTSMIVELVFEPGDRFIYDSGDVDFEGKRSCFMFKPGSSFEVAANSTFHYGRNGRGMLALFNGSDLHLDQNAELVMHGTLVIIDAPGTTEQTDMHLTLTNGARLTFAPGSGIHNANSIDQAMRLVVTLDGGSIDISGLSAEDQAKVVVITLPEEPLTEFRILGNPAEDRLTVSFASREEGTMHIRGIDALGRSVIDRSSAVDQGENMIHIPIDRLSDGSYILEMILNEEQRVLRFVKE